MTVCDLLLWQLGVGGGEQGYSRGIYYSTTSTQPTYSHTIFTLPPASHPASHPHTLHLPSYTLTPSTSPHISSHSHSLTTSPHTPTYSPGVSSFFPATSPSAYIFVTLVFWYSSTSMNPLRSNLTPVWSIPRSTMLASRPTAQRRQSTPEISWGFPSSVWGDHLSCKLFSKECKCFNVNPLHVLVWCMRTWTTERFMNSGHSLN